MPSVKLTEQSRSNQTLYYYCDLGNVMTAVEIVSVVQIIQFIQLHSSYVRQFAHRHC